MGSTNRSLNPKGGGTGGRLRLEGLESWIPHPLGGEYEVCLRLIAFDSCAVALSTETAPSYQDNAPGLIRTIGLVLFPVELIMRVLNEADLFTSNVMVEQCLERGRNII